MTSRYALAVQHERGEPLDTADGRVAHRVPDRRRAGAPCRRTRAWRLTLTAGDLDEAVAGLLTNGMVASNVNGETVPAGFTRIVAFRSGLGGDADLCYDRFK